VKRGGSLKRRTKLKPRREQERRVAPDRVRDPEHRARVRRLPCASRLLPGAQCRGDVQCSHRDEGKGMGLKTSDLESVPMCAGCHDSWTNNTPGAFHDWPKATKRLWFVDAIADTLIALYAGKPEPAEECPF
jgi:hypothetical protein